MRREKEHSTCNTWDSQTLEYQTGSSSFPLSQAHSLPETLRWPSCLSVCAVHSFTLWFSHSSCVLVLHRPFPFSPPLHRLCSRGFSQRSDQRAKAKSTHCYLGAARSWRGVQVCVSERESWCVCFRLQANRSG